MIGFLALGSTTLTINCRKDNLVQRFLGCSMKEYYFFVGKDDLRSTDKIQEMTKHLNKRQGLVNFTVKDSCKDVKKHINLVSFEWVSE